MIHVCKPKEKLSTIWITSTFQFERISETTYSMYLDDNHDDSKYQPNRYKRTKNIVYRFLTELNVLT